MAAVSETRDVWDFTEVALLGYDDIVLKQNPASGGPENPEIEVDDTLMPRLSSEVKGRWLALFACSSVALFEKSLCRGSATVVLARRMHRTLAIILPSLAFGGFHFFVYKRTPGFWIGLGGAFIVA